MHPGPSQVRHLLALWLAAAGACTVDPPGVLTPPDQPVATVSTYADVVLGISVGDQVIACTESGGIPLCGQGTQTGECAANPALGHNDDKFFELGPGERVELGFLCAYIREVGGNAASDDFKIWGQVTGGAQPVVEVSTDGTHYVAVNFWPAAGMVGSYRDNPGFQLEVPQLAQARFVRISEVAGVGHIRVDAIEAFPIGGAQ